MPKPTTTDIYDLITNRLNAHHTTTTIATIDESFWRTSNVVMWLVVVGIIVAFICVIMSIIAGYRYTHPLVAPPTEDGVEIVDTRRSLGAKMAINMRNMKKRVFGGGGLTHRAPVVTPSMAGGTAGIGGGGGGVGGEVETRSLMRGTNVEQYTPSMLGSVSKFSPTSPNVLTTPKTQDGKT